MEQASALRDQAARSRRMLTMIDDVRTRDVLAKMADQCQAKADAWDRCVSAVVFDDDQAASPAVPPSRRCDEGPQSASRHHGRTVRRAGTV